MEHGSGGQRRMFHVTRRLAELGHAVTVACPIPPYERDAAAPAGVEVVGAVRPASRLRETVDAVLAGPGLALRALRDPWEPWQLEVLWRSMASSVEVALRRHPDVVMVGWDVAAAWRRHVPAELPAVLELHDVTVDLVARRGARLEAARLRAHARRWWPRYDGLVTVSERDAGLVRGLTGQASTVVPNGVDTRAFVPQPERDGPPAVLFTGTMNYRPNAEGGVWLAREVWPRVRRARPDARLTIAGRHPHADLRAYDGQDGIEVAGEVPDMRPRFAAARVIAVPIHSGGGSRLKVLEAAAAGRAMVSTTIGAEGTDLRDGAHLVLADDAPAFADAVLRLLDDGEERARLAAAARALVEDRYDWDAIGERLATVLEGVA